MSKRYFATKQWEAARNAAYIGPPDSGVYQTTGQGRFREPNVSIEPPSNASITHAFVNGKCRQESTSASLMQLAYRQNPVSQAHTPCLLHHQRRFCG
ncbi:protein of unknown function (plasmid) [Paraburkholderia kururiensis]